MAKKKGQGQIRICDNNRDSFIGTLHNVLLALDICDKLFSNIMLINLSHNCLSDKGFCTCTLATRRKKAGTLIRGT